MNYHKSVLLKESVDGLLVKNGHKYIDATLGGAGHSSEIINRGGIVLGIDQDQDAIDYVKANFQFPISNFQLKLAKGNFRDIERIAKENGFEKVSGILFDLGVSSHQLDTAERGFSYLKSGPLDMRMDQELGVKASDLLNALGRKELYEIFINLGEEYKAAAITDYIIRRRRVTPFENTQDLVEVLVEAYGFKNLSDFAKSESSRKVFQALRIQVNDEIGSLKDVLPIALNLLEIGGRLVVISFHSLEDRVVKKAFLEFEKQGFGEIITKKPILPSLEEAKENSRSKASKLRIFARLE